MIHQLANHEYANIRPMLHQIFVGVGVSSTFSIGKYNQVCYNFTGLYETKELTLMKIKIGTTNNKMASYNGARDY